MKLAHKVGIAASVLTLATGIAASAATASAAPAHVPAAAHPHTQATGLEEFSDLNGMCLTVQEANGANGAGVDMETCHGLASQQWTWDTSGHLLSDVNENSPNPGPLMCLDDRWNNPSAGAGIDIYACVPGWAQQQFTLSNGHIVNANGNCLDITDANSQQGASVKLFGCGSQSNQGWYS